MLLVVVDGRVEHWCRSASPRLALKPVRADVVELVGVRKPSASVKRSYRRKLFSRDASSLSSSANNMSSSFTAEYARTTSGMVPRRLMVRSMDMTGVIPLPPTRNNIRSGGGSGRMNSP